MKIFKNSLFCITPLIGITYLKGYNVPGFEVIPSAIVLNLAWLFWSTTIYLKDKRR